jgi:hypothetical protein
LSDMGGHGRALEVLLDKLPISADCSLTNVMHDVRVKLEQQYPEWVDGKYLSLFRPLLAAVLGRHDFVGANAVVGGFTIDALTGIGLIRFEGGRIVAPYVWVWILASKSNDVLRECCLGDYSEMEHNLSSGSTPRGAQCWQHWEEFNARFRRLKSVIYTGEVEWRQLHAGAQFGGGADVRVDSTPLKLYKLSAQCSTRSSATPPDTRCTPPNTQLRHEMGTATSLEAIMLSASSNEGGDAFCGLRVGGGVVHEVHQYKHISAVVSQDMLDGEHRKAVGPVDFFLFCTTGESGDGLKLPARTALVDRTRFRAYYGPWGARAFYLGKASAPDVNTASRTELESVLGIGPTRAQLLLESRPFRDMEDCFARTNIPRVVLSRLALCVPRLEAV